LTVCFLFVFLFSLPALGENPVPFLNQPVVPGAVPPGGAQFTLTVNGAGFVNGSVVNWNGSALVTTYVSVDQLTAVVPAANTVSPGTASISVANPAPGGGTSNVVFFEITNPVNPTFATLPSTLPASPSIVADFNGDGKLDLAADSGVMLGNGDGTFQALLPYPSGFSGTVLLAADFNGDGILDLATKGGVMLGNGDGTFQAPLAYPNGGVDALLAGDFNQDGKLDLIYSYGGSDGFLGEVFVLLGNSDGTFAAPLVSGWGGSGPAESQAIGDFNGDGKLDLANGFHCCMTLGNAEIFLGSGDGTFQREVPFFTISYPTSMVVADFNGDGRPDIAVGSYFGPENNGIEIFFGNGDGTFQGPYVPITTGVTTLAAADLIGDGMLDLIYNGNILLNNGNGTFSPLPSTNAGGLFGDFNGDGRMDYVSGNQVFLQSPAISGLPTSALSFGNQQVGTSSTPQTVQVQNTGSAVLTFTSIQASANFPESDNCQPSVAVGASCTISLTFNPPAVGPLTGTLTLTNNASGSPQAVQLSGTGAVAAPNVSPLSLTFSNQLVGTTSASQPVTLTNTSTLALSFTSLAISSGWAQSNNCLPSLAPNASCTITVSFQPTASGPLTGTLTLTDYAANSPQTVTLGGTGLAPVVSLSATSLTFAGQPVSTPSASQPVILTNTGTGMLTSLTIAASGDFAQTNNCPGSVAPTAGCTINVTFTPTAIGSRTGTLTLTDNAANSPQTVSLSGTGNGATATLSAPSLTFSSQQVGATSSGQSLTLQNNGNTALSITSLTLGGSNPADFALNQTCGNSVAAGNNCGLNVTFTPTARGTRSATVSIVDNAPDSPQTISLTGTGIGPTANLSASSETFPGQFLGTTGLPQNITLTNNGELPLTITSIQSSNAQFGITNGCTSTLAAGVNCTISVFFDPSASGTQTGTLTLTDSAVGSPQTIPLSGTGMDFSLSGTTTSATVAAGQTATYALTVAPEGGLNQTVSFACSGAPSLSTCTVPSSVTLNGTTSTPVTVSVSTTAGTKAPPIGNVGTRHGVPLQELGRMLWPCALLMLASLAALAAARKRRAAYLLGLSLAMIMLWSACAGGGQVVHTPGTPSGTYPLSVTATVTSAAASSKLTHSLSLTLNVN